MLSKENQYEKQLKYATNYSLNFFNIAFQLYNLLPLISEVSACEKSLLDTVGKANTVAFGPLKKMLIASK